MLQRVLASVLWLGSASLLGQVISWLSTLVVIRLLSPEDYGLMAMAGVPVGFLLLIADLGVGAVVVQAPTLSQRQLRALFGVCLLAYGFAAIATFLSAPLVAAFFAEPRLVMLVRTLSLGFVFAGIYAVPQSLLVRTFEFERKAKIDVLTTLVASLVSLWFALVGYGVWSLIGAALAVHVFRAVAFQIVCPSLFRPLLSLTELRSSLRFGGWVTVDRLVWFGYSGLDIAIAGRTLAAPLVGLYSVALSLASIPLDKGMSVITEVSFAAFSRVQHDVETLRRGVLRALETVSLLAFPTFLGLAAVAPEIVSICLGSRWIHAVVPLQILCLTLPFRAVGLLFAPALLGAGRPRLVVENNAIVLGCVAVALGIGVRWGVTGLCVGWFAGYVPAFWITTRRTLAALQIPARRVLSPMCFSMGTSLAMALAMIGARALVTETWPLPAVLMSLVAVGVGTYGAAVVALRPEMLRAFWVLSSDSR